MAIKEQCLKCKGYNPSADLCTIKWAQPEYNGMVCGEFADPSVPKVGREYFEKEVKVINPAIKKRGTSYLNNSRVVKVESQKQNSNDDTDKESSFVLKIPESAMRGFGLFLFVLLLCGIGYGTYWYMDQRQAQQREDLVWKARIELEAVKSEKTIEYLKLQNMDFTFKGQKSHKIDSVVWSVVKMRKIAEENNSIPLEFRKTNLVKTIITRSTPKNQNGFDD